MATRISLLFVLSLLITWSDVEGVKDKVKCPVQWVPTDHESPVPQHSVASDHLGLYIARAVMTDGAIRLGYADFRHGDGHAYFAHASRPEERLAYEVLTNPHGCTLNWVPGTHPELPAFTVQVDSSYYVGRAETSRKTLAAGSVQMTTERELTIADDGIVRTFSPAQFTVLLSFSPGLQLHITDFVFENSPFGGSTEMLGFDEISNMAETSVSQSISHSSQAEETYEMQIDVSSLSAYAGAGVAACILFFCFGVSAQIGYGYEESSSHIVERRDRDIVVSRTLIVPPFTAIQACSVYYKHDNFSSAWNARAEFNAPGLTAQEVRQKLREDPQWDAAEFGEDGNTVYTTITGKFAGTFVMSSKFLVSDAGGDDGGGGSGCAGLKAYLQGRKERVQNYDDFIREQEQIEQIMKKDASVKDCRAGKNANTKARFDEPSII